MLKIKHVYFLRPFFENWRIFSFKNIELANEHRKNAHLQQPLFLCLKSGGNQMNENKQLCPNCKTGADALKLDPKEPMCPYMEYHNGTACAKYEPMPEIEKE